MSRQPPPRGLPSRPPPSGPYGGGSHRGDSYDSYRPSFPESRSLFPPPPGNSRREPIYQFRGSSNHRSYDYYDPRDSRRYEDNARSSGDSYHPQDNFTFRYDAPPSVDFRRADEFRRDDDFHRANDYYRSDAYRRRFAPAPRPRSPPAPRAPAQNTDSRQTRRKHQTSWNNRGSARGSYRGRPGPYLASDRVLLKVNRASTPELMPGIEDYDGQSTRYKPVDDISDSEEAEMNISDVENEAEQPKKKQLRTEGKAADADNVPKWSNPDPYTVLPPLDESQHKKKDVVKLIRKARVTSGSDALTKGAATADDFISFELGDDTTRNAPVAKSSEVLVNDTAPTDGFISFDLDDITEKVNGANGEEVQGVAPTDGSMSFDRTGDTTEDDENHVSAPEDLDQDIIPPTGIEGAPTGPRSSHVDKHQVTVLESQDSATNKPLVLTSQGPDLQSDPALGNRKRTIRDETVGPPRIYNRHVGRNSKQPNGKFLEEWVVPNGSPGTPWLMFDHSVTPNMGLWLHKEIMDWYHHVKPRDFEIALRTKLQVDLSQRVRRYFHDADICCFGSFPAELFLPTSDMDLVLVSDGFMNGGPPRYDDPDFIADFGHFLRTEDLALDRSVQLIGKARVPIAKYQDKITGLRVDVSFENSTGLIANKTFQDWKKQYPAMPILVTLIKHLLAMRGLNEVVTGGIGGFSVTCLVVSMLQHMPQVQSRSMVPEHHLGECLMEFLDLYGNQFDTMTTAIRLNPPGYCLKPFQKYMYQNSAKDKFCIVDPNNSQNDISGGSKNTPIIRKFFSGAYNDLQKRMGELSSMPDRKRQSILGCILAGNYSSFDLQRGHLAHLHERLFGPAAST